jgi:hypothetical protein
MSRGSSISSLNLDSDAQKGYDCAAVPFLLVFFSKSAKSTMVVQLLVMSLVLGASTFIVGMLPLSYAFSSLSYLHSYSLSVLMNFKRRSSRTTDRPWNWSFTWGRLGGYHS